MGTDIHMIVQKSTKGIWKTIGAPELGRSYTLFGILAGVRGEAQLAICRPKGLPVDLKHYLDTADPSVSIGKLWLGEHNFSWFYLNDLLKYYIKNWRDEIIRDTMDILLDELKKIITHKGKYRIVFGFDS
jgi:hypothetical protein